jgi:hypothetical protein
MLLRVSAVIAALIWICPCVATPLSQQEIVSLCGNAEDAAHCGRLIEEVQLKRLPNLARRDGAVLSVSLYPFGTAAFNDSDDPVNGRSYSLWDFVDPINAVILYSTQGDATSFIVLRRATNRRFEVPAEPRLSPNRLYMVTADACPGRCVNEIAVWRISPEALRKELVWTPGEQWSDVAATWKDENTLAIEYTAAGAEKSSIVERKLTDAVWKHVPAN